MPTATTDQGISLPLGADAADAPAAFIDTVADVEPRLVRIYTNEADRTAKMLVLAANDISGLGTEERVEVYTGAEHISLFRRALYGYPRMGSDQLLTISNTTLQNVTDMVQALPGVAGAVFGFKATVFYDSATAADLKIAFTVPAGATLLWGFTNALATGASGTTGDTQCAATATSGTALALGGAGVATLLVCTIEGEVVMDTTAGNLQMQAAQNTSDATQSTLHEGSRMQVWRSA